MVSNLNKPVKDFGRLHKRSDHVDHVIACGNDVTWRIKHVDGMNLVEE